MSAIIGGEGLDGQRGGLLEGRLTRIPTFPHQGGRGLQEGRRWVPACARTREGEALQALLIPSSLAYCSSLVNLMMFSLNGSTASTRERGSGVGVAEGVEAGGSVGEGVGGGGRTAVGVGVVLMALSPGLACVAPSGVLSPEPPQAAMPARMRRVRRRRGDFSIAALPSVPKRCYSHPHWLIALHWLT